MSRSPEISASLVQAERGNGELPTTIVPDSAVPFEIPRSPIAPASRSGHGRGQGPKRPLPRAAGGNEGSSRTLEGTRRRGDWL